MSLNPNVELDFSILNASSGRKYPAILKGEGDAALAA